MQAELVDARHIAGLAKEKLEALTVLLNDRKKVLNREISHLKLDASLEFSLSSRNRVDAAILRKNLVVCELELRKHIATFQQELQWVQDDAQLKLWLDELLRNQQGFGFVKFGSLSYF